MGYYHNRYRPRRPSSAPKRLQREDVRIEFPSRGATYCDQRFGVYRYDEYPRGSVLAGQMRRSFLDSFETLEEAKAAYPGADVAGCGYAPPDLSHLPDGPDCDPLDPMEDF